MLFGFLRWWPEGMHGKLVERVGAAIKKHCPLNGFIILA